MKGALMLLLCALPCWTLAQKDYRKYEPDLSGLSERPVFVDPIQEAKPVAAETTAVVGDTTRRKVEAKIEMPPAVRSQQERYMANWAAKTETDGYRVQLYSGSRESAYRVQADVVNNYPQYRAEVFYDRPNFKVRMGDFLSRTEADRICKLLRASHPGAFVVPDKVRIQR